MNFGAAAQALVDRIKRQDKLQDAKDAINNAIAVLCTRPFARDSTSATLTLASTQYNQSFDVTVSPFARFRKVKWLRPTGYTKYVKYRDPARIYVNGVQCTDVWFMEGVNLNFYLSKLQTTCPVGYYQYHVTLSAATDTDWMIDLMWPAVRAYALCELNAEIGNMDESVRYEKEYLRHWDIFYRDLGDGNDT